MPENWKTYKLTELGSVARGKSKHRPRNASFLYGGDYPFIQTGDVKSANHRLYNHSQTYSEAGLAQSKLWPIGTMCITIAANIAETSILTYPACFPDSIIGFIPDENICDINFVEFMMQYFKKEVQSHSIGSVQDNINLGTFDRLEFLVPPLHEQKAIASILSALDNKIELNLQMNQTLEDMAMNLYKHWFVDFGPFQDGEFVDSELGMIPKGWEVKFVRDVAKVNSKSIKKDNTPLNIEYIDIASVKEGWVEEVKSMPYSEAPSRARRRIFNGDIVWSTVRPNRKSRFLSLGYSNKTIVSTGFAVLSPKIVPYSFLYAYTCTEDFVDYLVSRATGSSYPAVTGRVFEEAKITLPVEDVLIKYNEIAEPLFEKFSLNTIENQTLTQLRNTLLPKLISGEVRVKDVEQTIAEVL